MAEAIWPYFGSAAGLKALIWRFHEAWAAPEARVEKVASVMGTGNEASMTTLAQIRVLE